MALTYASGTDGRVRDGSTALAGIGTIFFSNVVHSTSCNSTSKI
jgi:hypothetical protein